MLVAEEYSELVKSLEDRQREDSLQVRTTGTGRLFSLKAPAIAYSTTSALLLPYVVPFCYLYSCIAQIGRLESENKSLCKNLENSGEDKQQLQEMQAMVMKMAAAKAEPTTGGEINTTASIKNRVSPNQAAGWWKYSGVVDTPGKESKDAPRGLTLHLKGFAAFELAHLDPRQLMLLETDRVEEGYPR